MIRGSMLRLRRLVEERTVSLDSDIGNEDLARMRPRLLRVGKMFQNPQMMAPTGKGDGPHPARCGTTRETMSGY